MKVRDAMTGDVLTFTPGRSLRDAAKFMADHNVGAVVVMDPEQPGPGIITERDLVRSLGKGEDPDAEHVSEHLTSNAVFADIEWDLEEAADAMARGGFGISSSSPTASCAGSSRCGTSCACGGRARAREPRRSPELPQPAHRFVLHAGRREPDRRDGRGRVPRPRPRRPLHQLRRRPGRVGRRRRGARAMGWKGFNCSLPHKVAVIQWLDELAESASLIGAVNCVVERDGRWIGENTDGKGFVASLRRWSIRPARRWCCWARRGRAGDRGRVRSGRRGVDHRRQPRPGARRGARRAGRRADVGVVRAVGGRVRAVRRTSSSTRRRSGWPDAEAMPRSSLSAGLVVATSSRTRRGRALIREAEALGCTRWTGSGCSSSKGSWRSGCGPAVSRIRG